MLANCGNCAKNMWRGRELLWHEVVDKSYTSCLPWNIQPLSTFLFAPYAQTSPQLLFINYLYPNTFFTQFPQRLLLPLRNLKERI